MRDQVVRPTGVERTFGEDEILVSKTDRRGVIRYANAPFLRVSAYEEHEVVGRPHNCIRHPDMPRCVFRLLWRTIEAGDEMFAYVVNLAADGAHYWVLAHVTPSFDAHGVVTGYHSNRRRPERGAVGEAQALYRELLAEEGRHTHPVRAVEASAALLDARLEARGQRYDDFVWDLAGVAGGRR